eukprot:4169529-Alexandrium_andersonii.AAC.1
MSASLVGSEMCIRDSPRLSARNHAILISESARTNFTPRPGRRKQQALACLLYTSDAADDM